MKLGSALSGVHAHPAAAKALVTAGICFPYNPTRCTDLVLFEVPRAAPRYQGFLCVAFL